MKYKNITLKKYQIIKHIINKYAETHDNVTPNINYDRDTEVLDISGISRPINFNTESIGIIPKGAYEVVGQVIRSRTDDGHVDEDGMNVYNSAQRVFNIANDNRQEVFDFITENSRSSYCACCGTNRDRNKLFYIRRVDTSSKMYQVGSRCITEYFDTSYFDLMKDISNVVEHEGRVSDYQFSDYNLIDYLALYCLFIKTTDNIKMCSKQVVEVLDSCEDVSETKWASEFLVQKATNFDKISAVAKFYTDYPNYAREDNMFAIKTVQSMADMLADNLNVDPYYSKSNCLNVAKMYISLLQDYASDLRKYTKDLFKYNAYLVETALSDMWNEQNHTSYKLGFALDGHVFTITIINATSPSLKNIKIVVPLTNDGNMVDESKSKSELISLIAKINKSSIVASKKIDILNTLNNYRDECITRYSTFKPTIVVKHDESTIRFFDYANEPLVLRIDEASSDIETAKLKLSTFINMSYSRQKLNTAYKEFTKRYIGNSVMAYTQSKPMNLQFSCDYAEKQFSANWPEGRSLTVSSYVDTSNKNVVIQYNRSSSVLKLPVNNIGIISGADHDINIRIQTFIAKELNLPMPKVRKERTPKTEEEKLKNRPKKNVTRLFNSLGVSANNLVSVQRVNVLNDTAGNTLGVSTKGLGKILFSIDNGNPICENDIYKGRISLDGHLISDSKTFDKKTFINAVHAFEYLVYLSDESNNLICNLEITPTKRGKNYTYKHSLSFGSYVGTLQFRIVQIEDKFTLKYGPKFVINKTLGDDKVICTINLNFSEKCWKDIQDGVLKFDDIQRSSSVLHGQKNNNMISGVMWINDGEPQKLTNTMFSKLTGIEV